MSSLREMLEEALEDAETSSALGDDYKAYLQLQKATTQALTQLTELERDHEAMEKALETIKMLHANHASILGDRCSMALDMGEIATKAILGAQAEEAP